MNSEWLIALYYFNSIQNSEFTIHYSLFIIPLLALLLTPDSFI